MAPNYQLIVPLRLADLDSWTLVRCFCCQTSVVSGILYCSRPFLDLRLLPGNHIDVTNGWWGNGQIEASFNRNDASDDHGHLRCWRLDYFSSKNSTVFIMRFLLWPGHTPSLSPQHHHVLLDSKSHGGAEIGIPWHRQIMPGSVAAVVELSDQNE